MKYLTLLFAAGLALAGCGGGDVTVEPAEDTDSPAASLENIEVIELVPEKNVGDIQAGVKFELTIDGETAPANVTSEEIRNQFQKLSLVNARVEGQHPTELWLNIRLETQLEFPKRPVAARGRLIREVEKGNREEIYTFETVFDKNASVRMRRVEGDYPPQHFRTNAFQGLAAMPETMLLYAEMDVVIMPEGTDPATLDPRTATGASADTGVLLSNPLRIDFIPGEAPAPEPTTPESDGPEPVAPAIGVPADAAGAPAETAPAEAAPAEAAPASENG